MMTAIKNLKIAFENGTIDPFDNSGNNNNRYNKKNYCWVSWYS